MKEVDINTSIDNNAPKEGKAPKKSAMLKTYESLKDIPSRLKYIVDSLSLVDLKKKTGQNTKALEREEEEAYELLDIFLKKYIVNGTKDNIDLIYKTLGELEAETEYNKYLRYINIKNGLKEGTSEKVAKWLVEYTDTESKYIMTRTVKYVFTGSALGTGNKEAVEKIKDNIWKDSSIDENTTMKEYAIKCGVEKSRVNDFLKSMNASANQKVYDYYRKIMSKQPKRKLKEKYIDDTRNVWLENGKREYYTKKNINTNQLKTINQFMAKKLQEPYNDEVFEAWIKSAGNKEAKKLAQKEVHLKDTYMDETYNRGYADSGINVDELIDRIRDAYNKAQTMEEELSVLIEYGAMEIVYRRNYVGMKKLTDFMSNVLDDFVDTYINKGSMETIEKCFETIGRKAAENVCELTNRVGHYLNEFSNEDKAKYKAEALAWKSSYGVKSLMYKNTLSEFKRVFYSKSGAAVDLINKSGLNLETTILDYAKMIGMNDKEAEEYVSNHKAKPDDKAIDILLTKIERENKDAVLISLEDHFKLDVCGRIVDKGSQPIFSKFTGEKRELLTEVTKAVNEEVNLSKVDEWLEGEAAERYRDLEDTLLGTINTSKQDIDLKTKNYDNYIKLHTGKAICDGDVDSKKDNLLKAFAANILKKSGAKFSVDRIHKYAEKLKKTHEHLDVIGNEESLNFALSSSDNLDKVYNRAFGKPFSVNPDNISEYISEINKLAENMMSSEGRSDEYKAFAKAVKNIADLSGKYDYTSATDIKAASDEIIDLNMKLFLTAQNYITGKEKVRTTTDGKERFNNAIDALSIMSEHTANVKEFVDIMVDVINTKRKATLDSNKYVDINLYGAARAEKAKQLREEKPENTKSQKIEDKAFKVHF